MSTNRYIPWLLGVLIALFVALALPWPYTVASQAPETPPSATVEAKTVVVPQEPPAVLGDIHFDTERQRYVASAGDQQTILTLKPDLQAQLRRLLVEYRVPWGATVLLEPHTGRVLAMAEHSQAEPNARDLSLRALAPAASIFKIVTSAALLERGVGPDSEVCYHGGKHRIQKRNLADDPRRDHRCLTLASALGRSANVVFAKLADRDLSADLMRSVSQRFFFNVPIPFAKPVEISRAEIPDDPFERATTAAGFGPVRLSPLHGALLAAMVANGGLFIPPQLVDTKAMGMAPVVPQASRVMSERVAAALAEMMRTTVIEGTARRVFRKTNRRSPLAEVAVAGKTGSLSDPEPFRDYSWFVGFAPVDKPQVAVATVIVNERLWRVKASFVAQQALQEYFTNSLAEAQASVVRPTRTVTR